MTNLVVRVALVLLALACLPAAAQPPADARPPNVVVILADDLGYADLGCYGSPLIRTPRLDRMAAEGTRFAAGYSAGTVCTPSRAGLLTGCVPLRVGMVRMPDQNRDAAFSAVLFPNSPVGLHPDEATIADLLKRRGYATGMVGKWHLGDAPEFLPTRQGFDFYFGIPYSNDMRPTTLFRNERRGEPFDNARSADQFTDEAIKFVREHRDRPFFLYVAHTAPHTPLAVPDDVRGKSPRGLYGDVVESVDRNVGRLLDALAEAGVDDRTLVIFTSDNGPWLIRGENGGSAGPLREGKGTTWEGGVRVPLIARWPGKVPAGRVSGEVFASIDFLPTFAKLADAPPPDKPIDGRDASGLLLGQAASPRATDDAPLLYYAGATLEAVRVGQWKLRFERGAPGEFARTEAKRDPEQQFPAALYDLDADVGERRDVAAEHPEVVAKLRAHAVKARREIGDRRTGTAGTGARPIGRVDKRPYPPTTGPAAEPQE